MIRRPTGTTPFSYGLARCQSRHRDATGQRCSLLVRSSRDAYSNSLPDEGFRQISIQRGAEHYLRIIERGFLQRHGRITVGPGNSRGASALPGSTARIAVGLRFCNNRLRSALAIQHEVATYRPEHYGRNGHPLKRPSVTASPPSERISLVHNASGLTRRCWVARWK